MNKHLNLAIKGELKSSKSNFKISEENSFRIPNSKETLKL